MNKNTKIIASAVGALIGVASIAASRIYKKSLNKAIAEARHGGRIEGIAQERRFNDIRRYAADRANKGQTPKRDGGISTQFSNGTKVQHDTPVPPNVGTKIPKGEIIGTVGDPIEVSGEVPGDAAAFSAAPLGDIVEERLFIRDTDAARLYVLVGNWINRQLNGPENVSHESHNVFMSSHSVLGTSIHVPAIRFSRHSPGGWITASLAIYGGVLHGSMRLGLEFRSFTFHPLIDSDLKIVDDESGNAPSEEFMKAFASLGSDMEGILVSQG